MSEAEAIVNRLLGILDGSEELPPDPVVGVAAVEGLFARLGEVWSRLPQETKIELATRIVEAERRAAEELEHSEDPRCRCLGVLWSARLRAQLAHGRLAARSDREDRFAMRVNRDIGRACAGELKECGDTLYEALGRSALEELAGTRQATEGTASHP